VAARENDIEKGIMEAKNLAIKQKRLEEEKKNKDKKPVTQANVLDNSTTVIVNKHPTGAARKPKTSPESKSKPKAQS